MTVEEHSDLMRKGACFFCKETGRMAKDCKKKKKNAGKRPTRDDKPKDFTKKEWKKYIRGLSAEDKDDLASEMLKEGKEENEEESDEDF